MTHVGDVAAHLKKCDDSLEAGIKHLRNVIVNGSWKSERLIVDV
jgi:hypothetical protein